MSQSIENGDIKLFTDNSEIDWADVDFSGGDIILDDGLENGVLISILSNRRADSTDTLPADSNDKQGWWGDSLDLKGRKIGSKLWLRKRMRLGPDLLEQSKQDLEECLQWRIEDGIADTIDVTVSIDTVSKNRLKFLIIETKNNIQTGFDYFYNWRNQILSRS